MGLRDLPRTFGRLGHGQSQPGSWPRRPRPLLFGRRLSAAGAGEGEADAAVRGVVVLVRLEEQVLGVDGHLEDEAAAEAGDVDVLLVVVGGVDVRPADRGAEDVAADARVLVAAGGGGGESGGVAGVGRGAGA